MSRNHNKDKYHNNKKIMSTDSLKPHKQLCPISGSEIMPTNTDTSKDNGLMDDVWDLHRSIDHVVDPNLVTGNGQQNNDDWDKGWDDVLNIHEAPIKELSNDKKTKEPVTRDTKQKIQSLAQRQTPINTQANNTMVKKTKTRVNFQKHTNPYEDAYWDGWDGDY
jgi:hypothetical protein